MIVCPVSNIVYGHGEQLDEEFWNSGLQKFDFYPNAYNVSHAKYCTLLD